MLCFDKLKMKTDIKNINNIDVNSFIANTQNNELISYKYTQTRPYNLSIRINYKYNELIIEFTSKILKDEAVKLINKNNVQQCLENINILGICQLNIPAILNDAEVLKCDVTKDVIFENISNITNYVITHIKNNRKWVRKPYKLNGVVLEKVASTPRHKKRLTIYDKQNELLRKENADFLNGLARKSAYLEYFRNRVRFELNLDTKEQIRKSLNINNTALFEVLSANNNPILNTLEEILDFTISKVPVNLSLRDYERMTFLQAYNNDLQEVEWKIRTLVSSNTSIKKTMEPYRELLERLNKKVPVIPLRELLEETT